VAWRRAAVAWRRPAGPAASPVKLAGVTTESVAPLLSPAGPPAGPMPWARARARSHAAGAALAATPVEVDLAEADRGILAQPLLARTDLPAFITCSVDGWAVRGPGPWRVVGSVLAGGVAPPLAVDGTCVQIATGAMVPEGADQTIRAEDSTLAGERVSGEPRAEPEWRRPGDESVRGEELLPAGTPVTPGVIGLAASCGYDTLPVRPVLRSAVLVFGDELLTSGVSGGGRVRDALGPALPGWLSRLGAAPALVEGPVADTLDAHVAAISRGLAAGADLICTTGGTMRGPVDHLHPALARLGGRYIVNSVEVRPGFPMLLAVVPRPDGGNALLGGLPGNPQSAIVALLSLVAPAVAGMRGQPAPGLPRVRVGAPIAGRGEYTHLALVRRGPDGLAYPVSHVGSAMLRGLAQAYGFAVIAPEASAATGDEVALLPLPLIESELP
jgi:molybdopterin molybdotransferase